MKTREWGVRCRRYMQTKDEPEIKFDFEYRDGKKLLKPKIKSSLEKICYQEEDVVA